MCRSSRPIQNSFNIHNFAVFSAINLCNENISIQIRFLIQVVRQTIFVKAILHIGTVQLSLVATLAKSSLPFTIFDQFTDYKPTLLTCHMYMELFVSVIMCPLQLQLSIIEIHFVYSRLQLQLRTLRSRLKFLWVLATGGVHTLY